MVHEENRNTSERESEARRGASEHCVVLAVSMRDAAGGLRFDYEEAKREGVAHRVYGVDLRIEPLGEFVLFGRVALTALRLLRRCACEEPLRLGPRARRVDVAVEHALALLPCALACTHLNIAGSCSALRCYCALIRAIECFEIGDERLCKKLCPTVSLWAQLHCVPLPPRALKAFEQIALRFEIENARIPWHLCRSLDALRVEAHAAEPNMTPHGGSHGDPAHRRKNRKPEVAFVSASDDVVVRCHLEEKL